MGIINIRFIHKENVTDLRANKWEDCYKLYNYFKADYLHIIYAPTQKEEYSKQ